MYSLKRLDYLNKQIADKQTKVKCSPEVSAHIISNLKAENKILRDRLDRFLASR